MASIQLVRLPGDLAAPLSRVLQSQGHHFVVTNSVESAARPSDAKILFVGGDGPDYRAVVQELTLRRRDAAVIVVNRLPENSRWLDALELGAADYCGAPFEAIQVNWLIEGALRGLAMKAGRVAKAAA